MGVEVEVKGDILGAVVAKIKQLDQTTTIGLHEDAAPYPDGTDVVMVGWVQEVGAGEQAARPFVRGYFDSGGAKAMGETAAEVTGNVIDGRATPLAVGDAVGAEGVRGVRSVIEREDIIDTGHMIGEIAAKTEPT